MKRDRKGKKQTNNLKDRNTITNPKLFLLTATYLKATAVYLNRLIIFLLYSLGKEKKLM